MLLDAYGVSVVHGTGVSGLTRKEIDRHEMLSALYDRGFLPCLITSFFLPKYLFGCAGPLFQQEGPSSPTRDRTWDPCVRSEESQPLDHQADPITMAFYPRDFPAPGASQLLPRRLSIIHQRVWNATKNVGSARSGTTYTKELADCPLPGGHRHSVF